MKNTLKIRAIPGLLALLTLAACGDDDAPPATSGGASGSSGSSAQSGAAGSTAATGGSGGSGHGGGASGGGAAGSGVAGVSGVSGYPDGGQAGSAGGGAAGAGGSGGGAAGAGGSGAGIWKFETIETRLVPVLDQPRKVELVRGTRPGGERTYLLYIHAAQKQAPLVVMEQPYDGIDWTGEEVDERWAKQGPGLHPDTDGPGDPGGDVISYAPKKPADAAQESAVHLINGFAVVHDYGRFYAGGSLEDDIQDATAAFHFALARPEELDAKRVGVSGGSWGGMMTLFGSARAPAGVVIKAAVPVSPPSDFVDMWRWTGDKGLKVYPDKATFTAFYSPYWRRILAATGGTPEEAPAAWAPYQTGAVCAGLTGSVLAFHDTWDVLIPCDETRTLIATCPATTSAFFWPRALPIDYAAVGMDHGLFGKEPGVPTVLTFPQLHMHRALAGDAPGPLYALAHGAALDELFGLLREAQKRSEDVSYAPAILRELCDPRVIAFDATDGTMQPGATLLAARVNAVWGTALTEANVCESLAGGLPSP